MTITADGGPTLLIVVLVVIVLGVFAFRNRWSFTRRGTGGNGSSNASPPPPAPPPPPPAPAPAPSGGHHGGGHHGPGLKQKIATAIIWVLGFALCLALLVAVVHSLFGGGTTATTQPSMIWPRSSTVGPSSSEAQDSDRKIIESEDHVVTLTDGIMPDWIRVPKGYAADINAEGQESIGMQCSFLSETPPHDADGSKYWCDGPKPTAPWFRPYIYNHAAETVTFHYRFRYIGH